MSVTNSPNMNLPVPNVGTEAGPQYAQDINNCMTLIDQHTHTAGSGVPVTPSGININTALTFNNQFATSVAGMTLQAQGSTPANNTIYESGVDLYYVDGNGNNVRITQSGGVAGSPGSISNLTSPASAAYVAASKTFVWESGTSISANLDCASVLMRNISPNSTYALTLQPPAALTSNYSLTLPSIPSSQSFMTVDTSGNLSGYASISQGITRPNLEPVGQQISSSSDTFRTSSPTPVQVTSLNVPITTTGRPVMLVLSGQTINVDSTYTGIGGVIGEIDLYRGLEEIATFYLNPPSQSSAGAGASTNSIVWLDTPSAGSYTYTVFASASGGSGQTTLSIINCFLFVYEL